MIRLRFWRNEKFSDDLDPEVLSVFSTSVHPPELDPARLARARARVGANLRPEPASGGWLQRQSRLAYGLVGGGGLWSSFVGAAAAHKAATAIGIGVLIAGGATAEVTGIGPAVRDAVSPIHSSSDEPERLASTPAASETAIAIADDTATAAAQGAEVEPTADVPGNLTTQVRPNGGFTLRGVLMGASAESIEVQTSVDDVPLTFDLGDASVQIPGPDAAGANLKEYVDHLVVVTGACDTVDGALTEDCTLKRVTVLGNAGQNGPPEGAGQPADPGPPTNKPGNGPPEDAGPLADPGPPADKPGNGPPEDAGPPADPGPPANKPGNGPPEDPGPPADPPPAS